MAEETKQLPSPEQGNGGWMLPILVFFGGFLLILLLVMSGGPVAAPDDLTVADKQEGDARVTFVTPEEGAEVSTTFEVSFAAEGLTVEPAGEIHDASGHFHILIDEPFVEPGEVIPNDETHLHFGDGSLSTELTLEPGTYTLRLQFADGAHRALEGDPYRDEVNITVVED